MQSDYIDYDPVGHISLTQPLHSLSEPFGAERLLRSDCSDVLMLGRTIVGAVEPFVAVGAGRLHRAFGFAVPNGCGKNYTSKKVKEKRRGRCAKSKSTQLDG